MSIPLPTHVAHDADWNCQVLRFDELKEHTMDGRYRVAGSVCWPTQQVGAMDTVSNGFIAVAAENLLTSVVYVLMESEFIVVDPILRADGGIEYRGLSQFLNEAWAKMGCTKYFWTGNDETHRTYLLSVIRSRNIEPKPSFVQMPEIPEDQAAHCLNTLIEVGRIKINKDGPLFKALQTRGVRPGPYVPAVQAAILLAAALQRFPYRRPF